MRIKHFVLDLCVILNSDVEEVIKDRRYVEVDIDFLI